MSDALLFRFAQEELVYLMRALRINTMPGLEPEPLANLNEDHQALALAVADRTLRARGTISWGSQEQRSVNPIAAGVLRDSASPRYSLLVDILRSDQLNLRYIYAFSERAAIEHCVPEPGVHQFVAVPTVEQFSQHLRKLLAIEEMPHSAGKAGYVSQERLEAARVVASTNVGETIHILSAELPAETASMLAATLHAPNAFQHLTLWPGAPDQANNREPGASLMVVQGDDSLFLLWKEDQGMLRWEVIPARNKQAQQYLEKLLRPALNVLLAPQQVTLVSTMK